MKLHMAKAHSKIINFIVLQIMKWSFELYEMDLEAVTQIRCFNCSLCISKKKIQIYEVDNHHNRLLPLLSQFHNKLTCGKKLKPSQNLKPWLGNIGGNWWRRVGSGQSKSILSYLLQILIQHQNLSHQNINTIELVSFWIFLFSIGHPLQKFYKDKDILIILPI